ncbi:VTT domain-containing protein [Zhihengliuella sp.]|uniref:DedA family protein n=1 Tax=Zhihengliuella sp. TaxID=1954483 RepID=UPI002811F374|nr:VTT domain-containing protein [Zhihengliuella sp.]
MIEPGTGPLGLDGGGLWYHLATFVLVALDAAFPPLPAELLVLGSGPLAADGRVSALWAWLAAAAGCLAGDLGLYWVFRRGLTRWLDRFRAGRWVHRNTVAVMNRLGRDATYASLLGLRFVSGGRTASVAAAGLAGVGPRPFAVLAAAGSGIWAAWMMLLGHLTQSVTGWPTWAATLASLVLGAAIAAALAGALTWADRRRGPRA